MLFQTTQDHEALRAALAFLVLLVGSALAIMWFHADVNMYDAQREMYRAVTGGEEPAGGGSARGATPPAGPGWQTGPRAPRPRSPARTRPLPPRRPTGQGAQGR